MRYFILLVITALVHGIGCRPDVSGQLSEEDEEQLRQSISNTLSKFESSVVSGDTDRIVSFYADDERFHWVEDGSVRYRYKDEIRQGLEQLGNAFETKSFALENIEIYPLSRHTASATALFSQAMADSTGNGFSLSGAMTIILQNIDGRWQFLTGHSSSSGNRQR